MVRIFTSFLLGVLLILQACTNGSAAPQTSANPRVSSDDASGFVLLTDVLPDVILEIRYFSSYNFVGQRIDGYQEPAALCTRQAAEALAKADSILRPQGFCLKVFDAYRPQMAVNHFVRWAKDPSDTLMKSYFYPNVNKRDLFALDFIATRSGHTRGSTFDLTLFDMREGHDVDMGGPFDFFGPCSAPSFDAISPQQKRNRIILRDAMRAAGFKPLYTEWWHFTLRNEPYPNTYFTFPVAISSLNNM